MNRKQFLLLLGLVIVLGAAGIFVYRQKNDSWRGGGATIGRKLLPNFQVNDVARITITSGSGVVTLARENNLWRVRERGDYPANFGQISEMLLKFADLKIAQAEDVGPSQLGRFELLPPGPGPKAGSEIKFEDQNGKLIGSVLLGKQHRKKPEANPQFAGMGDEGWPDGRYVMAGAGASTVALVSDSLDSVQAKPETWVSKDFLNLEKPREIAVQFPEATNSWKLTRASETNDWQLADARKGEKLDTSKISSVTTPFSSASFNDVAPLAGGSTVSNTVMTVRTFDGFTYVADVGPKKDDNYPVHFSITAAIPAERVAPKDEKAEDKAKLDKEFQTRQTTLRDKLAKESGYTNWLYQIAGYSMDEILKPRQQLLMDASTNTPSAEQKPSP